jgi:hypothetical protein
MLDPVSPMICISGYLPNVVDTQVDTGHRRHSVPVTTMGSSSEEMHLLLQRNVMVSFFPWFNIVLLVVQTDSGSHIAEYKPILKEVEHILMEAGLDEEEMKKSAMAGGKTNTGQSRNRR